MKNLCRVLQLPIHLAFRAGELRTVWRVFLKFQADAIRVFAPALPGLIATHFFGRDGDAFCDQRMAQGINVFDFKAQMIDWLCLRSCRGVRFENFNKVAVVDLKVKPEQLTVLDKIEMTSQAKCPAVKIQAAIQIL